jgi:DNA-binding MarR family transcriptional regulator
MIPNPSRDQIDRLLFEAMAALYKFERCKVRRFRLNFEAFYLLFYLRRRSSAGMREIALEMGIHVSTATRMVDRLERRGLVVRKQNPRDRRNIQVALEPPGEVLVQASEDHTRAILQGHQSLFSADDWRAFIRTAECLPTLFHCPPDEGPT